jgi:hypothetical protein
MTWLSGGITITLSDTDHLAVEAMRMLRAHQGKWEYFGDLISFRVGGERPSVS